MSNITWVNHASFIFKNNDTRILIDPWLFGTAFNNGWCLQKATILTDSELKKITHIWISHEHPDHFHVPSLKHIANINNKITILYQETKDKRVINFCKKLGFKITELSDHKYYKINEKLKIKIGRVPFYDSWILIESEDLRILNLNDCVLKSSEQYKSLKKIIGKIDVLMVQFGYAQWEGNEDDVIKQKNAAKEKLYRLNVAVNVLEPKFTIPHASFFRFCHSENEYLNKHNNSVVNAVDLINSKTSSIPIVLKPGQIWDCKNKQNIKEQITFYENEVNFEKIKNLKNVSINDLVKSWTNYSIRLQNNNNKYFINILKFVRIIPDLEFYISDLKKVVKLRHGKKLIFINDKFKLNKHVKISSDSLLFIFNNDFGFDTLMVNGRFVSNSDNYKKMFRAFAIGSLNNMGLRLNISLLGNWPIIKRAIQKILS